MFGYYLDLALRSLKRNKVLTALMVLAIGLGIGASMTMVTVLHVMSGDPLPGRSGEIYYPHLDPLPLDYHKSEYGPDPGVNFSWPDAMALVSAHRAERQAAMAGGHLLVKPERTDLRPFYVDGHYTTADFFAMFGVPFVHGQGWAASADGAREHVVVLSETLGRKLFGSADATGRMVRLNDTDFRVVGVAADWRPQPLFYADASARVFSAADQFFVPLSAALDLKFDTSGNVSAWSSFDGDMKSPTVTWLQVWVQLKDSTQVAAYRQFLIDYSTNQKRLGRFERAPGNAHLYGLMEWLDHQKLVPADVRLQLWLALGFLLVCMVNIVALLLAKFLRRSGEVSVRRALGARRRDIFQQMGVESMVIGLAGGVLGLVIAQVGLWSVRRRPDDYAHLAQMDPSMLIGTLLLAVFASMLAGLLPAWRACRITPALQLKTL
ncbi:ABC transporter permease [Rhodanobacter sp. L36]|uniref:ABC transporter permease n=1 Tax=Rhodanobacter sp. L36 TaxID=1747221 RepID=UPI00131AB6CB|nr:ABC transporter permease [Rhodanobacter sp. L36]